jgi:hypothetical protein
MATPDRTRTSFFLLKSLTFAGSLSYVAPYMLHRWTIIFLYLTHNAGQTRPNLEHAQHCTRSLLPLPWVKI